MTEPRTASRIEEEAARWLLRQEEPGWTAADQAALDAWLAAAPEHQVAYYRLEYGWRQADRLAALGRPALTALQPVPAAPPARSGRSWRHLALAASLVAATALGTLVAVNGYGGAKTYATEVGGQETVPLPDGSKLELNTDTRLRASVGETQRVVWLDRGEAFFDVAHDPARPFTVYAGARKVVVLGTKFAVRRDGGRIQVAVLEGRVRVEPLETFPAGTKMLATADSPGPPKPQPAVVTRGTLLVAEGASTIIAAQAPQKVESALGWRQGMLLFDQRSLAEAAAEFNRYNRKKIVVANPEAAAMQISGSFEAENVDAFARLLKSAYGLAMRDEEERVTIL